MPPPFRGGGGDRGGPTDRGASGGRAGSRSGGLHGLKRRMEDYINGDSSIPPNIEKLVKMKKPSTFGTESRVQEKLRDLEEAEIATRADAASCNTSEDAKVNASEPSTAAGAAGETNMNDEAWSSPKKTTPPRVGLAGGASVPLQNAFEPLSRNAEPDSGKTPESMSSDNPAKLKKMRPPQIHFAKTTIKELQTLLGVNEKDNSFFVREVDERESTLHCADMETHQKIIGAFKNKGVQHYTFTPANEKPKLMLIKGLNKDFNDDEIKACIEALQVPDVVVTKVMPITFTRRSDTNTVITFNHHLVQLAPGSKANNLFNQTSLAHQAVKWEYFRRSTVFQCHNCQRFGHTSRHCGFGYRCVKCDATHSPGECPRSKNPGIIETTPPPPLRQLRRKGQRTHRKFSGLPRTEGSPEIHQRVEESISGNQKAQQLPKIPGKRQVLIC